MIYAKKTLISVFIVGLLALAILSVIGLVFLTRMAYSEKPQIDGKSCGDTSTTERNIARLSVIILWLQFSWIIIGSFLQSTWAD